MKIKNLLITGLMAVAAMGSFGVAWAEDVSMFTRHEVVDYGAWRKVYNSFAPTQKELGVISKSVYQSNDDQNDVTVIHVFHSLEKAKAFASSPKLKAAMEKAGVKGAPQIWYATKSTK